MSFKCSNGYFEKLMRGIKSGNFALFDKITLYTGNQPANTNLPSVGTKLVTMSCTETSAYNPAGSFCLAYSAIGHGYATGQPRWFRASSNQEDPDIESADSCRLDGTVDSDKYGSADFHFIGTISDKAECTATLRIEITDTMYQFYRYIAGKYKM